ncbi:zinc-dependent alcohol dehydrogenase family protein [Agrobacterium vaccinii]|uniref:zinc-dependent alcohol dehydrogenase family protein n=1 Tax=Agrobacterium vaccinii TaxID=2735528 RepID=UPI001E515F6A|nr:NAD(P)-dependent alcohol dehydrogenase [Agrobacterium vaccinii]UHS58915.1 NAD(P)-dependent alcohol dehydrogenase [Agrobacterium vaccinii]
MKAYQIGDQNGLECLTAVNRPDPVAGPGQVVVAPRLISLISRDVQILRGVYGPRQSPDRIPISEGVGVVVSVGDGVGNVAQGDRVVCGHFAGWIDGPFRTDVFSHDIGVTHDGWLAERVVIPADALIRVPDDLDDTRVAGLASVGLTAWNALIEVAKVKEGELVVCLGTGSVSLFALKLAKALGARVAITSSSDAKLAIARDMGADILINYHSHPEWASELMAQNDGVGANIIMETGGQDTLGQSIAAAAANARIVVIGVTPGTTSPIPNYTALILRNITIRGIANGNRSMFSDLLVAIKRLGIETLVDRTFPFDEANEAFAYYAEGKHIGRVMISVPS